MSTATLSETGTGIETGEGRSGKYLTFILGEEEYGIEILVVNEIISVIEITSIPNMPEYVKGVINLRGNVIPIVDLRRKFSMPYREYDKETCIIVVNLQDSFMGVAVDTVSEVLDIADADIDDPPSFGGDVHANFIHGMGKVKDKVKILLDIKAVLKQAESSIEMIAEDLPTDLIEN